MTAIPKCTTRRPLDPANVPPGTVVHLTGGVTCRSFVVTSALTVDPVTGHEVWQVMEMGDEAIVEGAEQPFTGVVLNVNKDNARQWHYAS